MDRIVQILSNKWFQVIVAIIVLGLLINLSIRASQDALMFFEASLNMLKGEPLYGVNPDFDYIIQQRDNPNTLYSPLFHLIVVPFAFIPHPFGVILWNLCSLILFIITYRKFSEFFPKLGAEKATWMVILPILCTIRFLENNIGAGQVTFFILFLSFYGLYYIIHEKPILGAALLALGINIKLLPLVFIPYLIYRGYFKGVGFTLLFLTAYFLLPALYFGWEGNMDTHTMWFQCIDPTKTFFALETKTGLYNLSAFVPALFSNINYEGLDYHYHILALETDSLLILTRVLRIFFIGLTLAFVGFRIFQKPQNKTRQFWELSYIFLVIPLIFPRQSKYAFTLLLPAIYYLVYVLLNSNGKQKMQLLILLVVFVLLSQFTSINIVGRELYNLFEQLKFITFATFILIAGLILTPPDKAIKLSNHE